MREIQFDTLATVFGGMGRNPQSFPPQPTTQAPRPTPTPSPTPTPTPAPTNQPSLLGNICRTGYTALGGALGGIVTSETGGWGAVPGAMIGSGIGTAVCPP